MIGKKNQEGKEAELRRAALLDYLLLTEKDEKMWSFCQRKWDLHAILSSASWSLYLGLPIGISLRIIVNHLFFGSDVCSSIENVQNGLINQGILDVKTDFLLFSIGLISGIVLILLLWYLRRKIFDEYYPVLNIYIYNKKIDKLEDFKENLKKAFGDKYFKSKKNV